MLTIDECKTYLGIDFDDNQMRANIQRFINVADSYLEGSIGEYPKDDERAKQLALFIVEDLYDRKSYTVKENSTLEKLKNDFMMQLKLEKQLEEKNNDIQDSDYNSET